MFVRRLLLPKYEAEGRFIFLPSLAEGPTLFNSTKGRRPFLHFLTTRPKPILTYSSLAEGPTYSLRKRPKAVPVFHNEAEGRFLCFPHWPKALRFLFVKGRRPFLHFLITRPKADSYVFLIGRRPYVFSSIKGRRPFLYDFPRPEAPPNAVGNLRFGWREPCASKGRDTQISQVD